MGVALKSPSIASIALKSPPNPYTQSEAIRALTEVADPPTQSIGPTVGMGPAIRSGLLLAQESW